MDRRGGGLLYRLYQRRLRRRLDPDRLPHHVAMIIDGNRRWARQRGLDSTDHGYRAGADAYRVFLGWCDDLGIEHVTLYLLSNDNLAKRPAEELDGLYAIIGDLADDLSRFRDWRVQHVGSAEGLPDGLVAQLAAAEQRTAGGAGMHINLAVGYGGRREIVDAIRTIVREHGRDGGTLEALAEDLTPEKIGAHLYTGGQPDPDLVIRTSGEQRLSDFMLWQSAHSEFYFVEALGPDFREVDFLRALRSYAERDRRLGR
ncbi:MAG: isoprenyl transferase [Micrococcales bacterium 73-13]|nr:MAG: isoprenyl transferase [Micrococcales bacterium 73-13]